MAAATSAAFIAILRRYQLLEPAQLDEVEQQLAGQFPEPKALARELMQRDWLTAYQVNQIGKNQAATLRLGNYVLLERLGEGGMGTVFKAQHTTMGRVVALKLIHKERLADATAIKRFHREIQAAAQLTHPNVVRAFDADQVDGTHLFVMEYVEGIDLNRLVKEQGPLPVAQACDYIRQAACGLAHAQEQNLVHRDIKPHNLLLAKDGTVKILDLGLARVARPDSDEASSTLTKEGTVMGTLDYIAPEQAMDSHTVDIRADLYSLGCTFYFLLTGRVPFPGGEALAKLMKHRLEEPVPVEQLRPEVPSGVAGMVRKLMAKKPDDRYQTPDELAAALESRARRGTPDATLSTHANWAQAAGRANLVAHRPMKRMRWPLLAGVVVLGVLLVAAVVLWWQISRGGKSDANGNGSTSATIASPAPDPLPRALKNRIGMEFVLVSRGKFLMGGGGGKPGTKEVAIPHDFYLGKYEVTQWEWMRVMGKNPSTFASDPAAKPLSKEERVKLTLDELQKLKEKEEGDKETYWKTHPVEQVSWEDCQEYIKRLNQKEKTPGWEYRLPTEAEWEYACRGGGGRPMLEYGFDFYFEQPTNNLLPDMANFGASGKNRTCNVGSYRPNRLGLYDMHGNVWEWCQDEIPGDPKDPKATSQRVHRGGSWGNVSWDCRAAYRNVGAPSSRRISLGLRLARVSVTTPAPANAPFDAHQAWAHQQAWALHLGTTIETTNSIGMKLALIPPGKFRIGAPDNEPGRAKDGREGPQHDVEITRPFYLGVYPVTVGQFREFVKTTKYQTEAEKSGGANRRFPDGKWANDPKANWLNPGFDQTDDHPVVCVSWNDAERFCEWLSKKEGKKYGLPTEAPWEYSCRAGSSTKYYFGNNDVEAGAYFWHSGNSGLKTHPVGEKKPNAWGLYDMGGNVRNWCQDIYDKDYYKVSPKEDPAGPNAGRERVLRGGSWRYALTDCRPAFRHSHMPSNRSGYVGFRVVLFPASLGRVGP